MNLITPETQHLLAQAGLLFSSGRHKSVHGGFAAAVRAAETREQSSPVLELRIRGNQENESQKRE